MNNFYQIEEDSKLLLKNSIKEISKVKKINLKICEMGVGSGFVINNIEKKFGENFKYFGFDINEEAIKNTKKNSKNIKLKKSNLFEKNKIKYDIVLFNLPYHPLEYGEKFEDLKMIDKAIYGGEKGWEVFEKFIKQLNKNLNDDGFCLIIFSDTASKDYIFELCYRNNFLYEILQTENFFFEKIFCVKIKKINLKLKNLNYLTRGKRSFIYTCLYKNKNSIVKINSKNHKEILILKKLEKYNFVPKLYFSNSNLIIMEKIEGKEFDKFIENNSKKNILEIIQKCFKICYELDKLKIQKFELTNPYKHILIDENKIVKFIDFERSLFVNKIPKNQRQFLECLKRKKNIFQKKNIFFDNIKIIKTGKNLSKKLFFVDIEKFLKK